MPRPAAGPVANGVGPFPIDFSVFSNRARALNGLRQNDSPSFNTLTLTGGQIAFPATQNASSDANTLDDYIKGSFTGTLTGCTTAPTATIRYTKAGNLVVLSLEAAFTATSNATTKTITGMPSTLWPATGAIRTMAAVQDNGGAFVPGLLLVGQTGVINLFSNLSNAGTAFTAAGVFTVDQFSIAYII